MIRALFWILLLANIGLFAAMQWGVQLWGEPVVVQPELNAEKISLRNALQVTLLEKASANTASSAVNAASMQLALDMAVPTSTPENIKPKPPICLEWGEFSDAELQLANAALSALELGEKLGKRQVEHTIGYWVYIPPLKDKAAIAKKVAQLKERKISEYFVVQEAGAWRNAISLGVFKTEDAAQNYLNTLRAKEIRSAKVGLRNSKFKVSIFTLKRVDAATESKLTSIQRDFAGSEVRNVSCGLTR